MKHHATIDHIPLIAASNPEVAAEVRDLELHPPEDTPYDHLLSQLIK